MNRMFTCLSIVVTGLCIALLTAAPALADEAAVPPEIAAAVAALPDHVDAVAVQAALLDAGENWVELAGAYDLLAASRGYDEAGFANLTWLLNSAPHLDRLELTAEILAADITLADDAAAEYGYDRESEFFRRYVLNYRLDDEPVTDWRGELRERYLPGDDHRRTRELTIASVVLNVTSGFTEHDRGYYGNLADPLSVDNARAGTGRELALLTAAALRAQGFGTRFVRENRTGFSWVEVYTGDPRDYDPLSWLPVYPDAPERSGEAGYVAEACEGRVTVITAGDAFGREQVTARYSAVCGFVPHFMRNGEPEPGFEHWSVTAWYDGDYIPLDDLGYPLGELDYPAEPDGEEQVYYLGAPGEYRFQCGTRYPGAVVHFQQHDFTAEPGGVVTLEAVLDAPAELPAAALVERNVDWTAPGEDGTPLGMGTYLYLIVDDAEPSVRALDLLGRFDGRDGLEYRVLRFDTTDEADAAFIRENLKVGDNDELPVVVLVVDGVTKLYRRGFDLNIADWVGRALEG